MIFSLIYLDKLSISKIIFIQAITMFMVFLIINLEDPYNNFNFLKEYSSTYVNYEKEIKNDSRHFIFCNSDECNFRFENKINNDVYFKNQHTNIGYNKSSNDREDNNNIEKYYYSDNLKNYFREDNFFRLKKNDLIVINQNENIDLNFEIVNYNNYNNSDYNNIYKDEYYKNNICIFKIFDTDFNKENEELLSDKLNINNDNLNELILEKELFKLEVFKNLNQIELEDDNFNYSITNSSSSSSSNNSDYYNSNESIEDEYTQNLLLYKMNKKISDIIYNNNIDNCLILPFLEEIKHNHLKIDQKIYSNSLNQIIDYQLNFKNDLRYSTDYYCKINDRNNFKICGGFTLKFDKLIISKEKGQFQKINSVIISYYTIFNCFISILFVLMVNQFIIFIKYLNTN